MKTFEETNKSQSQSCAIYCPPTSPPAGWLAIINTACSFKPINPVFAVNIWISLPPAHNLSQNTITCDHLIVEKSCLGPMKTMTLIKCGKSLYVSLWAIKSHNGNIQSRLISRGWQDFTLGKINVRRCAEKPQGFSEGTPMGSLLKCFFS